MTRVLSCFLSILAVVSSLEAQNFESVAAKKARRSFEIKRNKLNEAYQKHIKRIHREYIEDLNESRKEALQKDDLNEAQLILQETKLSERVIKYGDAWLFMIGGRFFSFSGYVGKWNKKNVPADRTSDGRPGTEIAIKFENGEMPPIHVTGFALQGPEEFKREDRD